MSKKETIGNERKLAVEQFWQEYGDKVLAIMAVVGAGSAAILLVKLFLEERKKRKELAVQKLDMPQFMEVVMELGEDHGALDVSQAAIELASAVSVETLSDALVAVGKISEGSIRRKG